MSWQAVADKYGVTRQAVQSRVSAALPSRDYQKLIAEVERKKAADRTDLVLTRPDFEADIRKYGTMNAAEKARGLTRYGYERALNAGGLTPELRQVIVTRIHRQKAKDAYLALCRRFRSQEINTSWLRERGHRKLVGEIERNYGGFAAFLAQL